MTYSSATSRDAEERERLRLRRLRAAREAVPEPIPDAASFLHAHIIIDNAQPDADGVAELPFHLWDAQRELLQDILSERLLFILKARQLGISWLICAYCLWLCLCHTGRVVLMLSIGQDEADELLRRVNVMYWRLSKELRDRLPTLTKENTEEMAWANGSVIRSLPARKTAGSGYTASVVVLDEFAKNAWAREIYTAIKPTIDGGGKLIILSTANGKANLFYELCERAMAGVGRFVFRFIPWHARPGRDAAWYQAVAADAIDDGHMKQEYPATPEEAFEATEVDVFLPSMALWGACYDPDLPPLGPHEPCILVADAGESDDAFGTALISAHPTRPGVVAIRYARAYVPNGQTLDHTEIERDLRDLIKRYAVVELAYDPMLMGQMIRRIERDGIVRCEPFSQGAPRLEADKGLLDLTISRRVAHTGDATLRAHVENSNRKVSADGKRLRIVKRKHALKIDLCVAVAMGCYRALDTLMHAPTAPARPKERKANVWRQA